MAKVNGPLHSAVASGKVGDLVFGRNKGGQWVRPYVTPQAPTSPDQIQQQTYFGNAVSGWQNLSDDDRQAWISISKNKQHYDSLGLLKRYTGRGLYLRNSVAAQQIGVGVHSFPTSPFGCDFYPRIYLTQDAWGIWIHSTQTPANDQGIIVRYSNPQSLARYSPPDKWNVSQPFTTSTPTSLLLISNNNLDPSGTKRYFAEFQPVGTGNWPSTKGLAYIDAQKQNSLICYADADNFILSSSPTSNRGTQNNMLVYNYGGVEYESLVRFDISALPAPVTLTSAILRLTVNQFLDSIMVGTLTLFPLVLPWQETTSTWNNYNTGSPWNVPGAMGAGTDYYTIKTASGTMPGPNPNDIFEVDIIAMVQNWYNGTWPNYGFKIRHDVFASAANRSFATHESVYPWRVPLLLVTWS